MSKKNPAAVELGRRGGLKGGPARAAALSREERRRIAQKAAQARWAPIPLACPFCHTNNIEYELNLLEEGDCAVGCEECGIVGPIGDNKNEAIKKWNGITEAKPKQKQP
jgi:hypothetical protein